jgi:putative sigma-54 modulation protein
VEIPSRLKETIEQEVERLTRVYDQILEAEVAVGQEKHRHTVDVRVHVNGRSYQAEGVGDNLKVPLDEAIEKLRRQLQRHKSKLRRQSLRRDEVVLRGKAVEVTGIVPEVPELPATPEVPRKMRPARDSRRRR